MASDMMIRLMGLEKLFPKHNGMILHLSKNVDSYYIPSQKGWLTFRKTDNRFVVNNEEGFDFILEEREEVKTTVN